MSVYFYQIILENLKFSRFYTQVFGDYFFPRKSGEEFPFCFKFQILLYETSQIERHLHGRPLKILYKKDETTTLSNSIW